MAVTVRIPTILRSYTGGSAEVAAQGATLADVIEDLEANHPGLRARLLDDAARFMRCRGSPGNSSANCLRRASAARNSGSAWLRFPDRSRVTPSALWCCERSSRYCATVGDLNTNIF